ncbi:hypothetical protein [Streptomyces sp. NPDC006334]|uniref:hypothetical protein n=1 Tax=Streptomyces sp. NPDC006334 TaxID=3156754 RepID=UPI0033A6C866
MFEVDSWTRFLDAFEHLGDGRTRMVNLKTSLVALLVAKSVAQPAGQGELPAATCLGPAAEAASPSWERVRSGPAVALWVRPR